MDIEAINTPVAKTFNSAKAFDGIPEVTSLIYDLWLLRITLKFVNVDSPVYVTFDSIRGFRVLDEGDLLEFWNPNIRPGSWLWQIEKGGWFDLERFRSGFVSGLTGGYTEFLILGINECISVISCNEPTVRTLKR